MQAQMEGRIDFLESQVKKLEAELGESNIIIIIAYNILDFKVFVQTPNR